MVQGVGPERDPEELKKIASDPSNVFEVEDVNSLQKIRKQLVTDLCEGMSNHYRSYKVLNGK